MSLTEREEIELEIAWAIAENFDLQSERIRNILLIDLAENNIWEEVSNTLTRDFSLIDEELKEILLQILWKKNDFKVVGAEIIMLNYGSISKETKNLLFRIPKNEEICLGITEMIAENYNSLKRRDREDFIHELRDNRDALYKITKTLIKNYSLFSQHGQGFLIKLLKENILIQKELNLLKADINNIPTSIARYFR